MNERFAIVMAAGKGTRMKSDRAKVLIEVLGRPMIDYVLDALAEAGIDRVIAVVGHDADLVRQHLADRPSVQCVLQSPQRGTGHAVMVCRPLLEHHDGPVLVVAGDSPLMRSTSIRAVLDEFDRSHPACILGTGYKDDPRGLGRIVRDEGRRFLGIAEEKDASDSQREIKEVNLSTYVFNCRDLLFALERLSDDNAQKEYYLTDVPGILQRQGRTVLALDVLAASESLSINTREELSAVEQFLRADPGARGGGG